MMSGHQRPDIIQIADVDGPIPKLTEFWDWLFIPRFLRSKNLTPTNGTDAICRQRKG
jgi:hypothetical protein